jgi:hypothetical protein
MSVRALLRFAAITATVMLSAISVASAGHGGGGHGGGGGGGFHGGGFHGGGFHGGGFYGGGRGSYGGWRGGYGWHGGRYGGWCCGWGWGFGLGWYVPFLPWYYDTYWWNGIPYYYADGDYYLWDSDVGQYEAVDPPSGLSQVAPQGSLGAGGPAVSSELFAYPKAGQSKAQQKLDKDDCRRWAATQTGFDPAQAARQSGKSGAAAEQSFLRAQAACLEGRNYSVR